jgi:hypothetical protein
MVVVKSDLESDPQVCPATRLDSSYSYSESCFDSILEQQ